MGHQSRSNPLRPVLMVKFHLNAVTCDDHLRIQLGDVNAIESLAVALLQTTASVVATRLGAPL